MVQSRGKCHFKDPNLNLISFLKCGLRIEPAPIYHADVQVRPKCMCVLTTVLGFRGLCTGLQDFPKVPVIWCFLNMSTVTWRTEKILMRERRRFGDFIFFEIVGQQFAFPKP